MSSTNASDVDVHVDFLFNLRGSSPFPFYRESVHGSVATITLLTGGTYTNVFASSSKDHVDLTDNGDGIITITVYAAGGSRFYDQFGSFVDFADRDFCADLVEFTS